MRYTNQFGVAIGPPELKKFRGRHIRAQPCMPWWFGNDGCYFGLSRPLNFDELCALSFTDKKCAISVVCSSRQGTEQHNRRLAFVTALKEELGDTLHWFGNGINPVRDKSEAIVPYRYHLVLENNIIPHFWTEKLADAFLGDSFPIVAGGTGGRGLFFS
jgi:Glycosyltransferase family 10 (fucosyltransferase) C-term